MTPTTDDRPASIGVDVGGTKIASGLVTASGTVLETRHAATPLTDQPLLEAMVAAAADLRAEVGQDLPVGVGFPGLLTLDGMFRYGPNISLREYPLRQHMVDALGGVVVIDNDANAATWAEFVIGAGIDVATDMMMFTLGTGVGGGIVAGGHVLHGANGFAGELGHLVVDADGMAGPSGVRGEIEAYSSGTAIGRLGLAAARRGAFEGTSLGGVEAPTSEQITTAALAGVAPAVAVLTEVGHYLGIAAAGLANCLDPEMIVIGGGAAAAGELILQPARDAFSDHLLGVGHRPHIPIIPAALGPLAGTIGAGLLAQEAALQS